MTFSERLRELLDEHDITQKKLASDLMMPPSTLGGYMQGTSEPDFETLKLLARYFGVTADYLLGLPNAQTKSEKENELLRIFRSLSSQQQELYLEQGKAFIKINARQTQNSSKSISGKTGKLG
ncbi:MAG: helix-turn-helix transcriptional regulator [Clostridia bacterium]|nr:helix-turn-helix transcriptional regulator [Clostridia bacterium]